MKEYCNNCNELIELNEMEIGRKKQDLNKTKPRY